MKLDVKTLYKIYEKNYDVVNKCISDSNKAFMVLNDALIYSCLQTAFKKVDVGFSLEKFKSNILQYEKEMGTPIFFLKYKTKIVDEFILLKIINNFNMILGIEKDFTLNAVEEVLGSVLEQHINRKETGSYYTPTDTTSYITKNAILMAIAERLPEKIKNCLMQDNQHIIQNSEEIFFKFNRLTNEQRKVVVDVIDQLKIIDPTCGSGAFIITTYNFIMKMKSLLGCDIRSSEVVSNTLKTLHGLDNSSEAIVLMKMRLILKILSNGFMIRAFDDIFAHNFVTADAFAGKDYIILKNATKKDFDWKKFGYKFDVIIGNPPYIEISDKMIKNNSFETAKCGNLYAMTIERACNICSENGIISFIVPLSFITTPRMKIAREYVINRSNEIYFATFADRPGCIFKGVHQRLTIFTAKMGASLSKTKIYTSKYLFWYNEERKNLFNAIKYVSNADEDLPKIGEEIDKSILNKIEKRGKKLPSYLGKGDSKIYLSTRIGFWTKCFLDKPNSSEFKELKCADEESRLIVNAFLNTTTFYYYWILKSDCWHVSEKDYAKIYFDIDSLSDKKRERLISLSKELADDLEKNKKYIGSKQVDYEYKHKYSKSIIDRIDDEFSSMFGFTEEELKYIKDFTLKYRMNDAKKD